MTSLLPFFVRAFAGVHLQRDLTPPQGVRVYFANHTSHLDFVVIWSVLPSALRQRTRPVAAADYWTRGQVKTYLAREVFRALLINREEVSRSHNPLESMGAALEAGDDLIIFPEGTRSPDGKMKPFKAGLYHLAKRCPQAELIPVHLENLNRILPKGEFLPAPLLGRVTFGPPLAPLAEGETKPEFLERAWTSVNQL